MKLQDQQFGVANDSEMIWFGILGLGYGQEAPGSPGLQSYPVVIDSLLEQNYTSSKLFSLDLGSQGPPGVAQVGQIVFGGLDKNKYSGQLAKIPLDRQDAHYRVNLTGITHRDPTSLTATTISTNVTSVLIDSGTTLSLLPEAVVSSLASKFPGASPDGSGGYHVPCCYQNLPGSIDFSFGNLTITLPYSEFIWNSGDTCFLGVWYSPEDGVFILGDTFLRGAYTVFDQDNHALYMSEYETCGDDSDLAVVTAGPDVAARIQGNCNSRQLSTTSDIRACAGVTASPTGSASLSGTGPALTSGNPNGPVSVTSTEVTTATTGTNPETTPGSTSGTTSGATSGTTSDTTSETSLGTSSGTSSGESTVSETSPSQTEITSGATTTTTTTTVISGTPSDPGGNSSSSSPPSFSTIPAMPAKTSLPGPVILSILQNRGAAANGTPMLSTSIPDTDRRRQAVDGGGGFVGGAGPVNPASCGDATRFHLTDGQLLSGGEPVAVDPGVASMPLRVGTGGSISTTFSVAGGVLSWTNASFSGGQAGFCQMPDGQVYIVFVPEVQWPTGCVAVSVMVHEGECLRTSFLVLLCVSLCFKTIHRA